MTTLILVGLIVVLLAAAAYVGVLLVRRSRSVPAESDADAERPRTVADLIKRRVDAADDPDAEMSGDELFVPAVPRQDGVVVPAAPGGPATAAPSPQPVTPAGGLELGDAPWRRAARMTGAEPGGAWETAPLPVVAGSGQSADSPARKAGAADSPEGRTDEMAVPSVPSVPSVPEGGATAVASPDGTVQAAAVGPAREQQEAADPAAAAPGTEPGAASPDTEEAAETADPQLGVEIESAEPAEPTAASRPLSDPDLTPLMGIPVIRTATAETVTAETVVPESVAPEASPDLPAADGGPADDALPAPVSRFVRPVASDDDDVVVLLPPTPTSSFPIVAPAASGSPQPVWFRVVRRDGEPVTAAVVSLLDDRGREVDTTKTAGDGGGELHTPHGGRFLMIAGADGYQPRAALITVDEEPVELALLLPRSATVSGSVRVGGGVVRDAHVVVRQDHDVVDKARTAGDGHFRFDDLAEGTYTVAATAGPGGAVARVSLAEGADVHLDLDLH